MKKLVTLLALAVVFGCSSSKPVQESIAPVMAPEKVQFTINRTFNADINKVYKMWIDPKKFSQWLGPIGAKMSFIKALVKEGGTSQWVMTTPDGMTKYGQINFKTIKTPDLLVYTQNFCDKEGNLVKLPIATPYPDVLLTTVNFVKESSKVTTVTVTWDVDGESTAAERMTFNDLKPVMATGWNQSFEKLEKMLK